MNTEPTPTPARNLASLEEPEATAAFWYEFTRETPTLAPLVEAQRKRSAEIQERVNHPRPGLKPLTASAPGVLEHRLYEVLGWLASHCPEWPQKGWFEATVDRRWAEVWLRPAGLVPRTGTLAVRFGEEQGSTFLPQYCGFAFVVNWHASDSQILADFGRFVLARRPPAFQVLARLPRKMTGCHGDRLPFGKSAALGWLEVRRRKRGLSWAKYLQKYPSGNSGRIELDYRRQCCDAKRKADLIVQWIDRGKPLQAQDFAH